MALKIQTTGLEQYAPGGEARVKVMIIGGPGVGKTRWSSYFPRPFYADIEGGLASVADRRVPFASVNTSGDMLDVLSFLKQENRQAWDQRKYQTLVIDTLDAFQRKVKAEWQDKENKQVFAGWDAWGFLNAKMQLLMTRLLNLDMNVIVLVHYKDKLIKDDETGRETREIVLQLQGETGDTAFNDFDLVGWMGKYFVAEEGQKVEKRGLTFKSTPDKPFLKDRLYVTPAWMEVKFADTDYTQLFEAIASKIDDLEASEDVGEIPATDGRDIAAAPVSPAEAGSGALPPAPPAVAKLSDYDKPTLQLMAKDRGIDFKGNTLKGELIKLIEDHDAAPAAQPGATDVPPEQPGESTPEPAPADDDVTLPAPPSDAPSPAPEPDPAADAASSALQRQQQAAAQRGNQRTVRETEAGPVDTQTGELQEPEPTKAEAVKTVEDTLGGKVVAEEIVTPVVTALPAQQAPAGECDDCGRGLADQRADIVKLSRMKFRAPKPNPVKVGLCEACYASRKIAS